MLFRSSKIAMNVLNADSQSLESFGLLSSDVKCFTSLFHCIRFSLFVEKDCCILTLRETTMGLLIIWLKMHMHTRFSSMDGRCPISYWFDFTIGCS